MSFFQKTRSGKYIVAACLVVLSAGTISVFAQATRTTTSAARRIEEFNKQGDKAARDEMEREIRGKKPSKEELRRAAAIRAEIREDLELLQESYNTIVLKLAEKTSLSHDFVAGTAAKINRHASRLRTNLVFPKNEQDRNPIEEMSENSIERLIVLRRLCSMIYDFLTSSIVENPNVIEIESALKAKRSLDSIIELSSRLK